jgi:hypothetical protein
MKEAIVYQCIKKKWGKRNQNQLETNSTLTLKIGKEQTIKDYVVCLIAEEAYSIVASCSDRKQLLMSNYIIISPVTRNFYIIRL